MNPRTKLLQIASSSLGISTYWNLLGAALPLAVGIGVIPFLIRALGNEAFGLLTLLWAAIGYFSLFDFGLGRALTQAVAVKRAQGGTPPKAMLFTGAVSTLLPGLLGLLLLGLLANPLINWLQISPVLRPQAQQAMLLAACTIPLVTLSSGLRGILEGYEDFKQTALLRMFLGLLNFLVPALLVWLGITKLPDLVWGLLGSRLLSILLNVGMLLKHPRSGASWSFDRQLLGQLLGFGSWMTLSNLIGPFMVSADRYLIAAVLSAQLVAFYTVPQDLVIRLLLVPTAVATSLFPRLSLLYSEYNQAAFHQLYRRAYTLLALVMGGVLGALAWVAQPGLRLWLGDAFAEAAWPLSLVLLLGIFFNSLALLPLTALHAMRIVKKTSLLHLLELLVYLPVLWWLLQRYGLLGAAWAWTLRTGIDWLALQLLYRRARHQANLQ